MAATYDRLIHTLGTQPRLAHQSLFSHRHPQDTPPFHYEMIDDLHGEHPRVLEIAFRGAGKSTLAEEYIVIEACFRRFRNWIIVGQSSTRACERLAAIKHELDFNDHLRSLFGDLHGSTWNEDKVVLSNGVVIQAFGRGQSLRGTKHEDARPDGCLIDDIEDEDSVNTLEGRDKVHRWVMRTLLPALDPSARIRMLANMLDPDCLAVRLKRTGNWLVREYPWTYVAPSGAVKPSWPSRFPLKHIEATQTEYRAAGLLNEYMQEYMVQAIDPSTRVFTSSMFRIEPTVRTWQATYAMYDPARTVKASSAHTGKVVFSWIGQRLVVWEADGQLWMPDQIIADIFKVNETYAPVKIGVEKEGLEEFLLQPLRSEMTRRRQTIPLVTIPAPVGKLAFIRSLQPFFTAGDVVFARDFPVLREQLLSFPTGRNDVPNALAYALRMRAGLPVYDNFGNLHVSDDLSVLRHVPCHLAVNATRQYLAAVLVQFSNGQLRIIHDWLFEGDPGSVASDFVRDASLASAGCRLSAFAPPEHWRTYDTIGLQSALSRAGMRLSVGGQLTRGRDELRSLMTRQAHGRPCLQVSSNARWTLNAFAGGYARSVVNTKEIVSMADAGIYQVLMEGLESLLSMTVENLQLAGQDEVGSEPNYAVDAQGRRYLSAMPGGRAARGSGPQEYKVG